ncbi:PEP/pyruvate-binding domain-containing protein [Marinobacter segnicrescens]|uniref:PEP/pyruvate-binding domain-containing protein n=1 Tax=Marinobacter segnicrescens TaxID=430453 RepID=UPI003A9439E7
MSRKVGEFVVNTSGKAINNRLIILGAGKPFRGEQHSVLRGTTGHRRVLDWLLHAMASAQPEVHFVGGYQLDEVAQCYPDLHYVVNPNWATTGAAASLLEAPLNDRFTHYVSFADILFRQSSVGALADNTADIAMLVDTHWRSRVDRTGDDLVRCEKVNLHGSQVTRLGRDILPELADAEFVGLVKLSPRVVAYLDQHRDQLPGAFRSGSLSQLVEYLRVRGFSTEAVDVAGDWAELNDPSDLSRFILGTKAQTLHRLQGMVSCSRIEDQVSFTVSAWQENPSDILSDISRRLADSDRLVVRSSALSEDGFGVSNAGAYTSLLNIERASAQALSAAIDKVIASYPDGHPENQVLVQPMLESVVASGVAFTRVLATGAPYYVVNYDDITRSTESITSGSSREHKTLFLHRSAPDEHRNIPDNLAGLIPALREVESLLDFDSLDIEFAISEGGLIHILQVRPIAVQHELDSADAAEEAMMRAQARFAELQAPGPFLVGRRTMFGVMPDWNPAEIIGTRPGRLAASLYRYLILDDVWARQRAEYGYRDVRPQPLLVQFAGHPYIDIRASFNSFVPATLSDDLAGRLVEFYLDWLQAHPHLHDKVEFEVVPTCYSLDFQHWRERLQTHGAFSVGELDELSEGLRAITTAAFHRTEADLAAVDGFRQRFERLRGTSLPPLDKALALLEECRRYGTCTFSHLARSAFVAVTLLRSAVSEGVLSGAAKEAFMQSIRTVSHRFTEDAELVRQGKRSFAELVETWGHLRPGTYDITSASYGELPDTYLRPVVERGGHGASGRASQATPDLWQAERNTFLDALAQSGLPSEPGLVEGFLRGAIEGRELAKFEFTRHLSLALDCLAEFGAGHGIDREQMARIPVEALSALRAGTAEVNDVGRWLAQQAEEGHEAARGAALVELPPLLTCQEDFQGFLFADSHANYIGANRVQAECVDLSSDGLAAEAERPSLAGRIVLIPQADPGYDWLFGHGIAGLVTLYGGANSHMAIRAAEFGLPAAIGIGEARYARLAGAAVVELDPANKRLEVVH